jgi:uncharacterized protein with ParB-like and HNH nuclease domain/predicted transport protein
MQARDEFLTRLMQGPKQFLIPIFQRTYSWTHANCDQLFKDIVNAGSSYQIQSHFIGSLVLISSQSTSASIPQWQVIDGQQRLTTVTILIAALLDRAKELDCEVIAATQLAAIREYYLSNTYGEGDTKYKLLLTKGDKPALCSLIEQKGFPENSSANVRQNYQYFYNAISDNVKVEAVYQGILKLKVVEVVLMSGQDDPQAIFESLNSTGVDLSQADLIRNYVLMRQPHDLQTSLYEEQWYPMEQLFEAVYAEKFDRFAQDFLTLKTESNTLLKSRDVYLTFKHWFTKDAENNLVPEVLAELCKYARYYTAFSLLKEKDAELKKAFIDLRGLVEVASPVVIKFYDLYEDESLTKKEFITALRLLSSYVLRRSACDMQTRSLGNTFAALAHKISESAPLESLKVALARFSKNSRFPQDTEFYQALLNRDLYESRICRYVLDRLQNNSKENVDTTSFTIEHVMPQNPDLHKDWQLMLGDNWQEIQQTWLHRLGNLTLTAYNSEYQDFPFEKKKTISGGFNESPLRLLNKDIQDKAQWSEVEMQTRAERLAKDALKIWPKLEVSDNTVAEYVLAEKKQKGAENSLEDVLYIKENTMNLFIELREKVNYLGQDISLIIGKKNMTFYTLEGFIQALPRKNYLALILAIDFDELSPDLKELCRDTSDWSFITYGTLKGVYCEIKKSEDIDTLFPLFRRAYEDALA